MCQGTFTRDTSATLLGLSNLRASLLLGDNKPVMQPVAGFPGQWGESAGETPLLSSSLQEPCVLPILTQSCPPFIFCLFVCLFAGKVRQGFSV